MTIKTLLMAVIFLVLSAGWAQAHHLMVVQSSRVKPYEEALRGVTRICREEYIRFVVSELKGNEVTAYLREERPRLIIAIGADALEQVRHVRDIPVIYLMVLTPGAIVSEGVKNITGVRMKPQPGELLEVIHRALPGVKRIGLLYDPSRMKSFIKQAGEAARSHGLTLVSHEINSPREVPEALQRMAGEIDLFWMLPDTTVVTPETVTFILLFTGEHRMPVVTFSRKYTEMGALLALEADPHDMGAQAGEMAARVLKGVDIRSLPPVDAGKISVRINSTMIRRLGLDDGIVKRLGSAVRSAP